MDAPRPIKQLVEEAHNYEFSTNVPIKIYLRTADTLNRHAELYNKANAYNDAYILYLRFLDLLMNKISKYPKLKQDPESYKTYLNLFNKKAPIALKNAEEVRKILQKQIDEFNVYTSKLKLKREAEQKKALQLQKEKERQTLRQHNKTEDNLVQFDDEKFNESLKQFHSLLDEKSQTSPSYPSLPEFHHYEAQPHQDPQITKQLEQLPVYIETPPPATSQPSSEITSIELPTPPPSLKPVHEHKSIASTEGGIPLKTVFIPQELEAQFLKIASSNTNKKLETCGILCGKLSNNAFFITTLLIPDQESTANTCSTTNEEAIFEYIYSNDLFVLGWIHTHPTQSCFLSSVDLHTQNSYQIMLPEAMAIVCAPRSTPNFGVFRLTDPTGIGIITKCQRRGFHPHEEKNIYRKCSKTSGGHVVLRNGLPFECADLRKTK